MSKNDKKCKTILSRCWTEKGEKSGSSCDDKTTEEKEAWQVERCTDLQTSSRLPPSGRMEAARTWVLRVPWLPHLLDLGKVISSPLCYVTRLFSPSELTREKEFHKSLSLFMN